MSPARCRTLRCFDTAGRLILNGLARSDTDASPEARRERIARLVGSARAPNARFNRSDEIIRSPVAYLTIWYNTVDGKHCQPPVVGQSRDRECLPCPATLFGSGHNLGRPDIRLSVGEWDVEARRSNLTHYATSRPTARVAC